ncbi:MAG: hypothetical protein R3C11_10210 [Planctomycetaceae bacterium]
MTLIVVIFGCGVVVGGAITVKFIRHRMQNFEQQSETMMERIHSRLVWKYDLNEEQSKEAKAVIEKNFQDLIALRQEFRPVWQLSWELSKQTSPKFWTNQNGKSGGRISSLSVS